MIKELEKVAEQDPLAQLDEQDKELIWKMRYVCACVCVCVFVCVCVCEFEGNVLTSS